MLYWALVFLVISLVAGLFGFGGISAAAAGIARVLFFIAVLILALMLLSAVLTGTLVL
ncbi:MAG: DUF1328 domain-containing protein [Rhodospirillales bacterium 70-18]|nr:DUF1328 domain-containing protein [Rhodospirillales bacterium]OJY64029.1 MAG: DUF1328 domain-containing protein [Rhodospirillales bacterium 70-18]